MEEEINNLPKVSYANPIDVLDWKKQYLKEGHSVASTNSYYSFIKRYVGYGVEINQKSLNRFRSNNMQGVCAASLKRFFEFLVNKKDFPEEILGLRFDKSKSLKRFPKSIPYVEVEKLVDGMPNLKEKILTLISYEFALRISEALKLKWSDFNWTEWLMDKTQYGKVNLINTKGGKFRTLPVSPRLMSMLYDNHQNRTTDGIPIGNLVFDYGIMDYLNNKEKSLDENKFDYINFAENKYREILYKVSKEVLGKRINPHQLRHSKAQNMMDAGVPIESIKAFLGHIRISSTEVYAQASPEKIKKDIEEYEKNAPKSILVGESEGLNGK